MNAKLINVQNHKRLLAYGATTLLAAGIFTSTPVLATNDKVYPGGLCLPPTNSVNHQIGRLLGDMGNPNANPVEFFCPGINDEGGAIQGRVNYRDVHPGQDVICTLQVRERTGTHVGRRTRMSSGFSPDVRSLLFSSVPSAKDAYFFYRCAIPAIHANGGSTIMSYEIYEDFVVD